MNLKTTVCELRPCRHAANDRIIFSIAFLAALVTPSACAEKLNPVHWSLAADREVAAPGKTVLLKLNAEIQPNYHLYSLTTPKGGPIRTTVTIQDNSAVEGFSVYEPRPERKMDPTFDIPIEIYSGHAVFLIPVKVKSDAKEGELGLTARVRYQACSEVICLPPADRTATVVLNTKIGTGASSVVIPQDYQLAFGPGAPKQPGSPSSGVAASLCFRTLLLPFALGFATLFTPCVFSIVPFTVSYFLKGNPEERSSTLRQALFFCGRMAVLFTALGLLVTLVAGCFGVVQLSSSP